MPLYIYQCNTCGLRFERRVGMSERTKQSCDCGQPAIQVLPEEVGFTFNQPTQGILPQNTGISGIDTSYDRVIAQDAAKRWEIHNQREGIKRRVLRDNPSATKQDLSITPDGTYRVMSAKERKISETARVIDAVATVQAKDANGNYKIKPAE